jgi:hypothetical protein
VRRLTQLAIVALAAAISVLALGATGATASSTPAMPAGMAETLKANPGSVRTGTNTVVLETGFMVGFPTGQVGTQGASACPNEFACFWLDINFTGTWAGTRKGAHVWFRDYWYFPGTNLVKFSPGVRPGPGYVTFDKKVTSVYNNTSVTAGYHAYFNVGFNHVAPRTQVPYVGALLNDSFDRACICL